MMMMMMMMMMLVRVGLRQLRISWQSL